MKTKKLVFATLLMFSVVGMTTSCSCSCRSRPDIEPIVELSKIEVTHEPNKTTYFVNEKLDITGLEVTAYFSNDTTSIVDHKDLYIPAVDMSTTGQKAVEVRYKSKSTSFTITVNELPPVVTLVSIELSGDYKTQYLTGEEFDTTGMVITATYSDSHTENVNINEVSFSGFDSSTAGNKLVTATYQNVSTSFFVIVSEPVIIKLDKILISKYPTKTSYAYNEPFDPTGLEVTAYYTDGNSKVLADNAYTLSNPDMSKDGEQDVTVTYTEDDVTRTAYFTIYVAEEIPVLESISLSGTYKTTYYAGQRFDLTGLIVTAHYTNGSAREVTNYTYSSPDMGEVGEQTVTVSYTENGDTVTATIIITILKDSLDHLTLTKPTKTSYFEGEELDLTGFKALAFYASGAAIDATNFVTITGYDSSVIGEQVITVTYKEGDDSVSATFTVTVIAIVITKIEIASKPVRTRYDLHEELDLTGLVVRAVYNNGHLENIALNLLEISGFDSESEGTKTITIKYLDFVTTFEVKVIDSYTPIVDNVRYELDMLRLKQDGMVIITPDNSISNSGIITISRADKDITIDLVYKDCTFTANKLINIAPGGYISMMKVEHDEYALANIHQVEVKSNQVANYDLLYGFANEELPDDNFLPFLERDGFSYRLGGAPIVLGDNPSYIAIYNPNNSLELEIDDIVITYLGGEHQTSPYSGYHFNAVTGALNTDLSGNNNTPNDHRKSVWYTPTLNGTTKCDYTMRLDLMNIYNGKDGAFTNERTNEYDISADFILPSELKDVIKVTDAYINYPEGSYLANDESRKVSVSETNTITTKSVFGDDTSTSIITVSAKNAVLDHRGGPWLFINFTFDVSSVPSEDRSALYNMEYYLVRYFTKASEARPTIEAEDHIDCMVLVPNTKEANLTWQYLGYISDGSTPNIIYKNQTITPASGSMIEGQKYNIIYVEGNATYSFVQA